MPNSKRSAGDEKSILEKQRVRLYHRISTLQKAIRKSGDNSD
jgi:hypothetical protein